MVGVDLDGFIDGIYIEKNIDIIIDKSITIHTGIIVEKTQKLPFISTDLRPYQH